jgi:fatty acid desaturase
MLAFSVGQLFTMLMMAAAWENSSFVLRVVIFALFVFITVYSILIVAHFFTHTSWFVSAKLNSAASMLQSVNIGQSVQAYQLKHVRNHHRYNNDREGPNNQIKDLSSTFKDGKGDEPIAIWRYAFLGAGLTIRDLVWSLNPFQRWWGVGSQELILLEMIAKAPNKRAKIIRQIQLDRLAHLLEMAVLLTISWKWTLACYLPAFYLSFVLVNVQNYYEHYGAEPENRYADSVSYYGRIYNLLTFNDGYHQEHHLRPRAHWSRMPQVRREQREKLAEVERVVSPVPAIMGFLHRNRTMLHQRLRATGGRRESDSLLAPGLTDAQRPKSSRTFLKR